MSSAVMRNLSRGPEMALPCASQSVERASGTMSSVAPKLRAALPATQQEAIAAMVRAARLATAK